MFEVDGSYANRKGRYTVLEIDEPRMTVRYEDGTTADLRMNIQARIWENIVAEEEARQSRVTRRESRKKVTGARFYIYPISLLAAEEMAVPGWQEGVAATGVSEIGIRQGDRLIYYAIENQVYFAVATITGEPSEATPKDAFYDKQASEQMQFFPVDVDTYARHLDRAVAVDSIEVESQPDIKVLLFQQGQFIEITEDEFELLAEILTEVAVEEDDEEDEEDEEELGYED